MNEFDIIKNYFQKLSKKSPNSLNLNDDVFFDKKNKFIVSIDTYVEGNHFLNFNYPDLVMKKIIRSSISDLICKGVYPKYYFISASGNKKKFSKSNLLKISRSLNEEQNKYNIKLGGGDTVFSNKLSFTITSIGFAQDIVYRNKAKIGDDIYVTGNIGDSYLGLLALKNKIKITNSQKKYFIKQYYMPNIKIFLSNIIKNFANTSIDISDGLFADLDKMLNNQKLSYQIFVDKIPISKKLKHILEAKKFLKKNYISHGDDYQILFTASKSKNKIIRDMSRKSNLRITKIGTILKNKMKSMIVDHNNALINLKNKGYFHNF
jgi:thiamine-monophosphate kinase